MFPFFNSNSFNQFQYGILGDTARYCFLYEILNVIRYSLLFSIFNIMLYVICTMPLEQMEIYNTTLTRRVKLILNLPK